MFTPLDPAYQDFAGRPHANAMVAAMVTAGIPFEQGRDGFASTDPPAAQALIDNEAAWLPSAKQLASDQVDALYDDKIAAGFSYAGPDGAQRSFQIDATGQFNIDAQSNAALGAILNGEPWPSGVYFVAADNSHMPLPTAADMRAFATAAHAYVAGLILARRALKDAIGAATTATELDALDLTAGWTLPTELRLSAADATFAGGAWQF